MKLKIQFPLWFTLTIYWLITFALLGNAIAQTHGHFGYPLDDTYIHMAIAKHLVVNGYWGVSQNGFSSSTSSPLWTMLLAIIYKLFGVNDWAPFILSFICGNLTIILCFFWLNKNSTPLRLTIFLLIIMLFIPLPIMAVTGMEHILHGFLTLWLIYHAAYMLSTKEVNSRQLIILLLLSSLITITRYEGLFLIIVISFLFVISKLYSIAILVGVAGFLPLTLYGLYSISQGWYFFPNSILLKGNIPVFSFEGIRSFLLQVPIKLVDAPHILLIIIACLMIYVLGKERKIIRHRERYLIVLFLMITILHMQFASIGWFYRYESYLILVGCVILADMVNLLLPSNQASINKNLNEYYIIGIILSIFLMLPLLLRIGHAIRDYPLAVNNIYEQQYQMGLFLEKYYEGKSVAANDIGAINYLSNIRVLDLYGLGSIDVAKSQRRGEFNINKVAELTKRHDVDIVIIYNSWFKGKIPAEWMEIGKWQIANNVVCGDDTVSFYAPSFSLEAEAITNLKSFSILLPSTVMQSGIYINP
jgi:hypothetical protein